MNTPSHERILNSFPGTRLIGVVGNYTDGRSGATVLAVNFQASDRDGLEGTFVVKIGREAWAMAEEVIHSDPEMAPLRPTLAHLVRRTPTIEGLCAVAYEVAFKTRVRSTTLGELLDAETARMWSAQQQIRKVAHAIVDWNIPCISPTIHSLQQMMECTLGADKYADTSARMLQCLPDWDQHADRIQVEGLERLLPNPLLWVVDDVYYRQSPHWVMPLGRNHGDLHAGNIICLPGSRQLPKLIDFAHHKAGVNPFFDLAYLEFDVIRRCMRVERPDVREQFVALLDFSMRSTVPSGRPDAGFVVDRTWSLMRPLRQQAVRLLNLSQETDREDFEIAWWVAVVAAGLNFARKGSVHSHREPAERVAALLYAAFGSERLLTLVRAHGQVKAQSRGTYLVRWSSDGSAPVVANTHTAGERLGSSVSHRLPTAATPAAERARTRFLAAYSRQLESARLESLAVLVWRPVKTSADVFMIARDAIVGALVRQGFYAFFNDEITAERKLGARQVAGHLQRTALTLSVDLIVMLLEDDAAVNQQALDFFGSFEAAWNVFVLAPVRIRDDMPTAMRLLEAAYGGMHWYDDTNVRDDGLVDALVDRVLERAEARRLVSAFIQGARH